ncbi:MAG: hypothetical protein ACI9R3_002671 [Verrucomicrobiales bacterium]|jgi:hypothetical protein
MVSMDECGLPRACGESVGKRSAFVLVAGILVAMSGVGNAQDAQDVLSQESQSQVQVQPRVQFPRPAPVIPLATDVTQSTSVSVSRQFVVHGRSLGLRSAFSKFAESVKGDFLDLLYGTGRGSNPGRIDSWKNQIVIQIRDDAADQVSGAVSSRIQQVVPEGFRLEITARIGTVIEQSELRAELREELIRLLLAECILRDHKSVRTGGRTELLPRWLMAGVSEILRQKVHGRPTEVYEKVFSSGSVLSADEILTAQPDQLDSLSAKIFELSSAGLIQTLQDQVSGANRMRRFISELAVFTGPQRELLLKHFPGLRASRNSLEKWWALQMATMSEPGVFEWMTAEETEKALNDALRIEFEEEVVAADAPDALAKETRNIRKPTLASRVRRLFGGSSARAAVSDDDTLEKVDATPAVEAKEPVMRKVSCRIEDVEIYLGSKNSVSILATEQADLSRILSRAHPLFRTVIMDYQSTIGGLTEAAEAQVATAEAKFAELVARRTVIQRQAEAITDHLNWWEGTQMKTLSRKFDGFFEARDAIESDVRRRRSDPISQYLDALDREFRP